MNDPEPLSAILAEMRDEMTAVDYCRDGMIETLHTVQAKLRALADRIEAAAGRKVSATCTPRAFDEAAFDEAVARPNGWSGVPDPVAEVRRMRGDAPGNAAAMREALEHIRDTVTVGWAYPDARKRINAALSAPARNCDRFTSAEFAGWEWQRMCPNEDPKDHIAFIRWLFAPAEGGAE